VQCEKSFLNIKNDLDRILHMQVMLEIIEKTVLPEDPHPEVFQILHNNLEEMNKKIIQKVTPEASLIQLAHVLGFLPSFKHCSNCHAAITDDKAAWNKQNSTLSCNKCQSDQCVHLPLKYRKALEFFRTARAQDYQRLQLKEDEHAHIKAFLPKLFTRQIDRPLKSLALF
jgi:DNA repair protein RecO